MQETILTDVRTRRGRIISVHSDARAVVDYALHPCDESRCVCPHTSPHRFTHSVEIIVFKRGGGTRNVDNGTAISVQLFTGLVAPGLGRV